MSPAQAAAMARSFQGALNTSEGIAFATKIGVNPIGGPFGDNNYAGKLAQGIKELSNRGKYSDAGAYRIADAYGPEFAQAVMTRRMASQGVIDKVDQLHADLTPAQMQGAVDNQLLMNAELEKSSMLFAQLGATLLPSINAALSTMADVLQFVSRYVQVYIDWLRILQDVGDDWSHLPHDIQQLKEDWKAAGTQQQDAHRAAMDRNTASLDQNTIAIDKMRGDFTGYGSGRAKNAIPKGWYAYGNSHDAAIGRQMANGAITV